MDTKRTVEIELKVAEATQNDVGRGIVRIDKKYREILGVEVGDIVEIRGGRATGAAVADAYDTDRGLDMIRMDGLIRKNCRGTIGEKVRVRKIEPRHARKVVLSPAVRGMSIQVPGEALARYLAGRVVTRGDIISVGAPRRRSHLENDPISAMMRGFGFDVGEIFFGSLGLGEIRLMVVSTTPNEIVVITPDTNINVISEAIEAVERALPSITYEDIGGLKNELQKVRELIELPLRHPELFDRLGIEPPKGVLLHGPPGTGKTLIAKAVANESDASFFSISGPEIMSKFYGESEKNLRELFEQAEKNAPSIIFIDEIDSIAPKREEVTGEVETRVVAQLLALMDGLESRGKVIVIAATNRPNALDPALRRPGRFDREIVIGVPNKEARKEILQIHTRGMPLSGVDLDKLAEITHGFVGADLEALCKEAAMNALRRVLPRIDFRKERIPQEVLDNLKVTVEDFMEGLKCVEPSALREVRVEIPDVSWDDIGGLEDVKKELRKAVEWPILYPESFKRLGIDSPKGVLLYGAPGTGKTLLARALANEGKINFISIKGPELLSKWVGESEKAIREIFRKARQASPCIVFLDELDAIAPRRGAGGDTHVVERVVSQLLAELDGLEERGNVVVVAATNRPDMVDPALLRPGRFDKILFVDVPSPAAREQIFRVHTRKMPLAEDVDIKKLAELTEGFVGADIKAICRDAAMLALEENVKAEKVRMSHFEKVLREATPSVTKETQEEYRKMKFYFESIRQREKEQLSYIR